MACSGQCLSRTAGRQTGAICSFPETVPGILLLPWSFCRGRLKGLEMAFALELTLASLEWAEGT